MREGTKNFKGEFWVGQHVKVDMSWMPKDVVIHCDTGIIRKINGKFLKSPDLAVIDYHVWMDKDKWTQMGAESVIIVKGEHLTSVKEKK